MNQFMPDGDAVRPSSPRQVLLGLFILGQLVFLLLSNLIGFLKWAPSEMGERSNQIVNRIAPGFAEEQGHSWFWCEEIETGLRRYAQLTGQDQDWCLFAPQVGRATGFPALLLLRQDPEARDHGTTGAVQAFDSKIGHYWLARWNPPSTSDQAMTAEVALALAPHLRILASQSPYEAVSRHAERVTAQVPPQPVALHLSENEPVDIHAYIRWGNCRLRRYEGMLYIDPQPADKETRDETALRVSRRLRKLVREYHGVMLAYASWRLKAWQHAHTDEPSPRQVIILQRAYRIHGPDESAGWDGPYVIPLARWQPMAPQGETEFVLEPYDFSAMRFIPLTS